MNTYELMVIYQPELSEADVKKQITVLRNKIKELKGNPVKEDYLGLKNMAYEMKRKTKGYYLVVTFELNPTQINTLSTWIKLQNEGVLRNMITTVNK